VCAQNVHPLLAHRLPNTPLVDSIVNDLLLDFVPDGLADAAETFMTCDVTQL